MQTPEEFIGKEPTLTEVSICFHTLKNSENTPIEIESNELALLDKYMKTVNKHGKYYLGGQIEMSPDWPITSKRIDQVKKENIRRSYEYGEPCNTLEIKSIAEKKKDLEIIEKILEKYYENELHESYRPANPLIKGDKGGELYQRLVEMTKIGR
uniref:Uncharacterized protein n=1 Tax=viral metagenome TaxID=1070528 RepID=A0A6C0JIB1_9ZZZZ